MGPNAGTSVLKFPRGSDLAGSRTRWTAAQQRPNRRAQGRDPRHRPVGPATGGNRLGLCVNVPWHGSPGRCQRRPHPAGPPEGLGGESGFRCRRCHTALESVQSDFDGGFNRRSDRAGRVRRVRRPQPTPVTTSLFRSARGPWRCQPGDDRSRLVCIPGTDSGWLPQLLVPIHKRPAQGVSCRQGIPSEPHRARDDGLVGGMRALDVNVGGAQQACSPTGPASSPRTSSSTCSIWARSGGLRVIEGVFEGRSRETGEVRWTGTAADLVFGSNSQFEPSLRCTRATTATQVRG
ncbi:MAG: hypothetical protein Ct9H300mP31_08980 [Acidimicrobiaceae bacterium]|nr:MAG: hypothetical protein Ct9H300mP31_08980 [Acidimicrobiaceae bacterium]